MYENENLPDFKIYGYAGSEVSTYSGETLNTFNTLFSSTGRGRTYLAEKWGKAEFEKEVLNGFYNTYQKIGNLTLLPCKTIGGGSINTLKGVSNEINDYLYPFMKNLREAYKQKKSLTDKNMLQDLIKKDNRTFVEELLILMQVNHFFFEEVDSFDKFVDKFMLNDWEKLELKKYIRYSDFFKNEESEFKENIEIAEDYIKKATEFINKRSEKIIKKLKPILEASTN